MLFFIFFSFISYVHSVEVLLCDSTSRIRQYHIDPPKSCDTSEVQHITQCKGRLYSPLVNTVTIPVWACTLVTNRWSGTLFFFGSKVDKTYDPVYTPIDFARCQKIINSKRDAELGELKRKGVSYYVTQHPLKPAFRWPAQTTMFVRNIILRKTNITYDRVRERLFTSLGDLTHCGVSYGTCKTGKYTFLWSWNDDKVCPSDIHKNSTLQDIELHYKADTKVHEPVFLSIPKLAMTFYKQVKCPPVVKTCFGEHLPICLPNGEFLLIAEDGCEGAASLIFYRTRLLSRVHTNNDDLPATFSFVTQIMAEYARNVSSDFSRLECRLSNAVSALVSIVAKTHPSEALSLLTNSQVGAQAGKNAT